ncbi:hypothetical protein [Sphingobacterium sp. ML3W]|uniref:hypothetical protein n=1 Tax=Sphingobacterium sp. ML3W TaxID=1538644 RepID=UPI00130D79C6|nr:hypothetical protein [Sphingobacterium sp. ML3W]
MKSSIFKELALSQTIMSTRYTLAFMLVSSPFWEQTVTMTYQHLHTYEKET